MPKVCVEPLNSKLPAKVTPENEDEGVTEGVFDIEGVTVTLGVILADGVIDGVIDGVLVTVTLGVIDGVLVMVTDGVIDMLGVVLALGVGVGVGVAVNDGVTEVCIIGTSGSTSCVFPPAAHL